MKLAVDTTAILGKGAVRDTYNLIGDGTVQLAVVLEFDVPSYRTGLEKEEIIREKTLQK